MAEGRKRRWLRIPSPAMIIACVALFVALGGTSYAATKLAANSVGSKQIKSNAVTTAKIKNGAVTTAKIKGGAVTSAGLAGGAVGTAAIADGAVAGAKLADGAVAGAKLADGSVSTGKLAAGAVDTSKMATLPGARVRSNASQTIAKGVSTPLAFNVTDSNTGGVYNAAQPTRLTAPVAGTYMITAAIAWSNDPDGDRALAIRLNGSTVIAEVSANAVTNTAPEQDVVTACHLNAGDYVQAMAWQYQTSTDSVDSWSSPNYAPLFTMNWIAP
jgi:hypothetical protein